MNWIDKHRARWATKASLRNYYEHEIFDRIIRYLPEGPRQEVGAGPGFFSRYAGDVVSVDVEFDRELSACADVHFLPFRTGNFAAVIGIDVLHHLGAPASALAEIARVLRPGGRLVFVEPWAGPVGIAVYRHLHHEECCPVDDPLEAAFPAPKKPMDGNAWLPKALLVDRQADLLALVPELLVREVRAFGAMSYLLTGGFQPIGLPWPVVSSLARLERLLPETLMRIVSLRAIFVLERKKGF